MEEDKESLLKMKLDQKEPKSNHWIAFKIRVEEVKKQEVKKQEVKRTKVKEGGGFRRWIFKEDWEGGLRWESWWGFR